MLAIKIVRLAVIAFNTNAFKILVLRKFLINTIYILLFLYNLRKSI